MPVFEAPLGWRLTDVRRQPDVVAVIRRGNLIWIRGLSVAHTGSKDGSGHFYPGVLLPADPPITSLVPGDTHTSAFGIPDGTELRKQLDPLSPPLDLVTDDNGLPPLPAHAPEIMEYHWQEEVAVHLGFIAAFLSVHVGASYLQASAILSATAAGDPFLAIPSVVETEKMKYIAWFGLASAVIGHHALKHLEGQKEDQAALLQASQALGRATSAAQSSLGVPATSPASHHGDMPDVHGGGAPQQEEVPAVVIPTGGTGTPDPEPDPDPSPGPGPIGPAPTHDEVPPVIISTGEVPPVVMTTDDGSPAPSPTGGGTGGSAGGSSSGTTETVVITAEDDSDNSVTVIDAREGGSRGGSSGSDGTSDPPPKEEGDKQLPENPDDGPSGGDDEETPNPNDDGTSTGRLPDRLMVGALAAIKAALRPKGHTSDDDPGPGAAGDNDYLTVELVLPDPGNVDPSAEADGPWVLSEAEAAGLRATLITQTPIAQGHDPENPVDGQTPAAPDPGAAPSGGAGDPAAVKTFALEVGGMLFGVAVAVRNGQPVAAAAVPSRG